MFNLVNLSTTALTVSSIIGSMLILAIQFNIVFAIFNLIPIPPFDGSKVLFYFLPSKWKGIMYTIESYSFIIIVIFIVTGLGSIVISPAYNLVITVLNWILLI